MLTLLYCLGSVRHTSQEPVSSESGNGISYTSEHRHQNCKFVNKDCRRKKERKKCGKNVKS
jgi:hypothetical protein